MSVEFTTDLVYKTTDEQKTYGFDFHTEGSVKSGATLSSPSVEVDALSGMTLGSPIVNTEDFLDGGTGRKIPANTGVKVKVSGGVPGVWKIACSVFESINGDKLTCAGVIVVVDPVP